jgi:Protein of unknown function (DUF1071)
MEYAQIRKINLNTHIEKKNGLSYLSWAWAVDKLLMLDSEASWEYGEPRRFGKTLMVFCTVTAFGKKRTAQLPVMDFYNRAISNPDAYQVNTAMQRCLAKAISLHGIGLYIYAGEDLPEDDRKTKSGKEIETKETGVIVKPSSAKITPTAGAMDAFTKEERELLHVIAENLTHLTETEQLEEATHILESLTNEEKVAAWSLLGSKVRSHLKLLIRK